jgi:ABC-type lipoprotein export system ATPase subunit
MILKSPVVNDDYTKYVYDAYDLKESDEASVKINLLEPSELKREDWNIGLIVGPSGAGKSTALNNIAPQPSFSFDPKKALISNFDFLEPSEAAKLLTSIGLSSVPAWLRPYGVLSNGEQYRARLAMVLGKAAPNEIITVDEYTSVIDRNVAKAMSVAVSKYIRREGLKVVLASCHYDIIDWLQPDFVYEPKKGGAPVWGDWLWCGPPIFELNAVRRSYEAWDLFKEHHYLTDQLNKAFGIVTFEHGSQPVALVAFKPQPTGAIPNGYGLSRTVVLPDFQGMGIGKKVSEVVAAALVNEGKRVFTKTVNPALGEYRNASPNWRPTSKNGKIRNDVETDGRAINRLTRASYCHEYTGPPLEGFENLVKPLSFYRQ